jgi:hypothetical protein
MRERGTRMYGEQTRIKDFMENPEGKRHLKHDGVGCK